MTTHESGSKTRGRPRVYLDDADRAHAHRERVADALARAHMLETIFARPTPALLRNLAAKIAANSDDKARAAAVAVEALLSGLADGGGENASEAAANFVRYEFVRPSPPRAPLNDEQRAKALSIALASHRGPAVR